MPTGNIYVTPVLTNAGVGNGNAVALNVNERVAVQAIGTFSGATAKLQASLDGTNFFDVPTVSFTAPGLLFVELAATHVRGVLTSGTPSVSMSIGR